MLYVQGKNSQFHRDKVVNNPGCPPSQMPLTPIFRCAILTVLYGNCTSHLDRVAYVMSSVRIVKGNTTGITTMQRSIFHDDTVFEAVSREEWNALLASSATDVIFLTWEWQSAWWNHMHPGDMFSLVYRDSAGALLGIIPLFRFDDEQKGPTLSIIGCEEVSDYLDFIIAPEYEAEICADLLDYLRSAPALSWNQLQLCNVPVQSIAYRVLTDLACAKGLSVQVTVQDRCPVIALPATWDAYLDTLDKKQRHEIRRKLRRAESQADTQCYVVSDQQHDVAAQMESFIALHRSSRPEKDVFMDERMKGFFIDIAGILAQRDWLQLSFLEIDGRKAAALFSFSYNQSYQIYNSGYDPELYGQFSPGIVLIAYCIQCAIGRGYKTFDFLRGEEEYKYRMGAKPTDVHELIIRNP